MVDSERVFVSNSTIKAVLEYAASTLEFNNEGDCQWAKGHVAIDHCGFSSQGCRRELGCG